MTLRYAGITGTTVFAEFAAALERIAERYPVITPTAATASPPAPEPLKLLADLARYVQKRTQDDGLIASHACSSDVSADCKPISADCFANLRAEERGTIGRLIDPLSDDSRSRFVECVEVGPRTHEVERSRRFACATTFDASEC